MSQSRFFAWKDRPANRRRQQDMVYLAVIMDLYSRHVVGWATNERLKRDLALDALS